MPESPLSKALDSPLTLTLIRDTYQSGDDTRELLDFCDTTQQGTSADQATEKITRHLLDRVLPAAYAPRHGQPPPPYDLQTAQNTLTKIATRMNQDGTRDLQWWRIPAWAPPVPRVVVTGLVAGVMAGLVAGFVAGLAGGLVAGLADPDDTSSPSPTLAWLDDRKCARAVGLAVGVVATLAVGLVAWGAAGLLGGLVFGLVAGLGLGLVARLVSSKVWPSSLAAGQLARQWHTPIRLMRFLDDARERNVLRTVGPAYQFRHARLQDRLAEATAEMTAVRATGGSSPGGLGAWMRG